MWSSLTPPFFSHSHLLLQQIIYHPLQTISCSCPYQLHYHHPGWAASSLSGVTARASMLLSLLPSWLPSTVFASQQWAILLEFKSHPITLLLRSLQGLHVLLRVKVKILLKASRPHMIWPSSLSRIYNLTLCLSPWFTRFQPLWSLCCPLNTLNAFLYPGLCTCSPHCVKWSPAET